MRTNRILTIGHSTRSLEQFIGMLRAHEVSRLVDVRTVPRSRTNPQFNREIFPGALSEAGIAYEHDPRLGGLRRPKSDSPNSGWKNLSFRGYADHMSTPDFRAGLDRLIEVAQEETPVIMCAEAVPWRCHRSLIGDALLARGVEVEDILSESSRKAHRYTPFARVEQGRVTYPGLGLTG
jgi:uncharacterized protein (DUF488 family)